MKQLFFTISALSIGLLSCKEVPVVYDNSVRGTDTTYLADVETPQTKLFLVEEPSGVTCVNCPAGTTQLKNMNTTGPHAGKMVVVSIHAGAFTTPINKDTAKSIQDFRTDDGLTILNGIFGGDFAKPCASFDRLPIAVTSGTTMLDVRSNWEMMLNTANDINGTSPVNISINTNLIATNTYEVEVKVSYTAESSDPHAITVYATEDKINDFQEFPTGYKMYEHNNLFRKVISPWNGLEFLKELDTKEAGRVFIQRFIFSIDPSDTKQSFWKPENMNVVAFVHKTADDKRVIQTATAPLVP